MRDVEGVEQGYATAPQRDTESLSAQHASRP
jgi:hypothetical protein